jgi:two-component system chemotaxis response regulator CheY
MPIKILVIGQCGFDGPRMEKLLHETIGASVDSCDDGDDALKCVKHKPYDIILVNRVLADDGSSGLDVIQSLLDSGIQTPVMLVSDLPDAQEAAVELGAVKGFGKSALEDPATLALIKRTATAKRH